MSYYSQFGQVNQASSGIPIHNANLAVKALTAATVAASTGTVKKVTVKPKPKTTTTTTRNNSTNSTNKNIVPAGDIQLVDPAKKQDDPFALNFDFNSMLAGLGISTGLLVGGLVLILVLKKK